MFRVILMYYLGTARGSASTISLVDCVNRCSNLYVDCMDSANALMARVSTALRPPLKLRTCGAVLGLCQAMCNEAELRSLSKSMYNKTAVQ